MIEIIKLHMEISNEDWSFTREASKKKRGCYFPSKKTNIGIRQVMASVSSAFNKINTPKLNSNNGCPCRDSLLFYPSSKSSETRN